MFPGYQDGLLPIHFNVPGHEILLSTFVETAQQTVTIIEAFNQSFFDGDLSYQIFVLPPEEGSFKGKLKFVVGGSVAAVWWFLNAPVGAAFVKGLTDHPPEYWAELAGESLKSEFADLISDSGKLKQVSEVVVVEMTKGFLTKDTAFLERTGLSRKKFRDAYEARNRFYQGCLRAPEIQGVGFRDEPTFPVSRPDFIRLQVALPSKEEDGEPWLTGIAVLKVTSPNWDREDKLRNWKARDGRGRERYFRIEDEYFWRLVREERLSTHIIDTIKVQWAFRGSADHPRGIRVLKVIEFNGEIISEPLTEVALLTFLGNFAQVASDPDQPRLFD